MKLIRKKNSPFWWYDFYFEGKRYRGSTGEKAKAAAAGIAANALTRLSEGSSITTRNRKAPTLREFSDRFLPWVHDSNTIKPNTRRYYQYGWRLLSITKMAQMPIDQITEEVIDTVRFRRAIVDRRTGKYTGDVTDCSPAYTAQALRTLKVMLGQARKWKVLKERTPFTIPKPPGRDTLIDRETEAAIERELNDAQAYRKARHRAWLVMVIMQDTGMRPSEVFAIRLEDVRWAERRIWIPSGKTESSRRFVGISERMHYMLSTWCHGDESPGWLFPSRSKLGHLTSISTTFKRARDRAGLASSLVPYCARHTYGTFVMEATGNLFAVSKSMGHADIKSMEPYQHQNTQPLVSVINRRNGIVIPQSSSASIP